jgi:hypothetical protein
MAGTAERIQPAAELLNFRIQGARREKTNPEAITITITIYNCVASAMPLMSTNRSRFGGELLSFYHRP